MDRESPSLDTHAGVAMVRLITVAKLVPVRAATAISLTIRITILSGCATAIYACARFLSRNTDLYRYDF